ncbi:MAG: class I SAM-dependent methyltransferase [Rhodospirillaceae bacterium]|nr:class I SAM-dependent methyltransferase [Rhodospirillaceae bacterium]MBT5039111.1 class I SAM-dependent methyltransferase [Rhodospirillaceae bacterium]
MAGGNRATLGGAANSDMAEYWNDRAGPNWVRYQRQLDGQIHVLGEMAMDRAVLQPGQNVLDIGCGCGDSALGLARRVGKNGSVLGVDISAPMLDHARQRAALEAELNLRFEQADAQTHKFPPAAFEHAFSRFGVMFFDDPVAAFSNIRGALKENGRLSFVCWRALDENPWMSVALGVAYIFVAPPEAIPPNSPGPFMLAAPDRVREILSAAGYADISVAPLNEEIYLSGPGTVAEAAQHTCRMGPVARVLADSDDDTKRQVEAALNTTLAPYHDGTGVRMASSCSIVTAGVGSH